MSICIAGISICLQEDSTQQEDILSCLQCTEKSPLKFLSAKSFSRFTDPEPSDNEIVKKKEYKLGENCEGHRHYHTSREHLERYRSPRDDERQRSSAEESDRQRSREDLSRNRNRSSRDNIIKRSTIENLDRQRSNKEDVRYRTSKEDLRYRSPDAKDSDGEKKYRETDFVGR